MSSQRKSTLKRIIQIENEIKLIRNNKRYSDLRKNLNLLENDHSGGMVIRVGSPDNLDEMLVVRKNSDLIKNVISQYKTKIDEYTLKIHTLNKEKFKLKKQLFR
jgi:hypothetical protein